MYGILAICIGIHGTPIPCISYTYNTVCTYGCGRIHSTDIASDIYIRTSDMSYTRTHKCVADVLWVDVLMSTVLGCGPSVGDIAMLWIHHIWHICVYVWSPYGVHIVLFGALRGTPRPPLGLRLIANRVSRHLLLERCSTLPTTRARGLY